MGKCNTLGVCFEIMIRILSVSALLALVGASRVKIQSHTDAEWGASCDDLHTTFSSRLAAFQESVDSLDIQAGVSRGSQTRQTMRVYGILRTLRRARSCSWVMNTDSEDMVQAQAITQTLLAGNPCADAARSEMEAGSSAGTQEAQAQAMARAVSILMSDTCAASEIPDDAVSSEDQMELDAQLSEAEEQMQDGMEEMMEASEGQEGSFIQLDASFRFFRVLGVIFLMLFLLVACIVSVWMITSLILLGLGILGVAIGVPIVGWLNAATAAGYLTIVTTTAAALGGCAFSLYDNVLPRLAPQQ